MTEQNGEQNTDFTLITSFIDNECDIEERDYVLKQIEKNSDFKILFDFENNFTTNFRKRIKKNRPGNEILAKINDLIDKEAQKRYVSTGSNRTSYSKYYKLLYPIAAIFVIIFGYYIFNSININSKDFVLQSHNVYEKVMNNEVSLSHKTSNAGELQKLLTNEAGFNVFIPEVKDAILIGGIVNDMNDSKVVHFIHKSKDKVIYTMQISRNDLLNTDHFLLHKNHKQELIGGLNWIECEKNANDCTVIWFKNEVICSSVSRLEAKEMSTVLTNYK